MLVNNVKQVLVLGAGMVSRPLVRYLLDQADVHVTVASRTVSKAEQIIENHPDGTAISLDVDDDAQLEQLIKHANVVVSLLPYVFHVTVAKHCIAHQKHLVTTSYVSEEMQALDEPAKKAGVLLLNEAGLDPGIDHMSAMRIIDQVKKNNGTITSFRSTTGALPAHEANTNPFGYKFSWSPKGVLLASRNPAKWLENGEIISVPGEDLFEHYTLQDVPGIGTFENYPNRNSVQYKEIYGLDDATTVYRGTFRMTGWCETLKAIAELRWLQNTPIKGVNCKTYADVTRFLLNDETSKNLSEKTAILLGLKPYSSAIKRLQWLGLFDDIPLPANKNNPLDYLNVLTLQKMPLGENERDMIVMHHEFIADYEDRCEMITSTLLEYGIPQEDSAVARTVALPAAIAVVMILKQQITLTGVYRPTIPDIYHPILDELEQMNIVFDEQSTDLQS